MALDLTAIREQFPILQRRIDGRPLIYLDSAATAQKPEAVLRAMDAFSRERNANPHRGMHALAEEATVAYEGARATVAKFLGAARPEEIVFAKNCTEAINLVAIALSRGNMLARGDAIVLSMLEHHSNIVPWQQLRERKGIEILWTDVDDEGRLRMDQLKTHLATGRVKLVSITGQSNVLGVRPPIAEIIAMAHAAGALVFIDAAQLVAHAPINVGGMGDGALDCDFLAFSGHKLYGPTGIGVLYGKRALLEAMPPFLGGGMMIHEVTTEGFSPADIPQKFEAGTQPIIEAVGLAAAIEWLGALTSGGGWRELQAHEDGLIRAAHEQVSAIGGAKVVGPRDPSGIHGCVSFTLEGVHPHDLTEALGRIGICLRAGHHCTQPLHRRLGLTATTRLSVGIYNTQEEIAAAMSALREATAFFSRP